LLSPSSGRWVSRSRPGSDDTRPFLFYRSCSYWECFIIRKTRPPRKIVGGRWKKNRLDKPVYGFLGTSSNAANNRSAEPIAPPDVGTKSKDPLRCCYTPRSFN
jgi:hypothetical protein